MPQVWDEKLECEEKQEMNEKKYELRAESLLDKFGFWDGDMFEEEVMEYYDECDKRGIKFERFMCSRTLVAVIKKYLLPSIPFELECVEKATMHNPIRLVKIDDQEITDYDIIRSLLEGEKVMVTQTQVKQVIKEIVEKP